MLLLLALLTAFPPLSTDMYLPALPHLEKIWREPTTAINLTLSGFFIGYCFSLLLYGPLSDKYGRRPPLLVGISVYIIASLLSGFANGVASLTVLRIMQGAGAAAGSTMLIAILSGFPFRDYLVPFVRFSQSTDFWLVGVANATPPLFLIRTVLFFSVLNLWFLQTRCRFVAHC